MIQVYITSAARAYRLAEHYRKRGAYVCLGGLHVTALSEEAARHADTIFLGPGEDTWPTFLADLRAGRPRARYQSRVRTLDRVPPIRRDLIKRHLYLVPNSIVVSRGCPHVSDFCYKVAFFEGGRAAGTRLLRSPAGPAGEGGGVRAAQPVRRLRDADPAALRAQRKAQNLHRDHGVAIRRLHDLGVMVNGSLVFGMDEDDDSVFDRTVGWAIEHGVETATFHILTPYPGTALFQRMEAEGRLLHRDWGLYDTRHAAFRTQSMTAEALEAGYWRAYRKTRRVCRLLPVLESVLTGFGRHPAGASPATTAAAPTDERDVA